MLERRSERRASERPRPLPDLLRLLFCLCPSFCAINLAAAAAAEAAEATAAAPRPRYYQSHLFSSVSHINFLPSDTENDDKNNTSGSARGNEMELGK